jgi:hypothetical protein
VAADRSPWRAVVEIEGAYQEAHAVLVLVGDPIEGVGDPSVAALHAPSRFQQGALER